MKCPICGKEFVQSHGNQKRCSAKCTKKYHSRKESLQNKSPFVYRNGVTAGRD